MKKKYEDQDFTNPNFQLNLTLCRIRAGLDDIIIFFCIENQKKKHENLSTSLEWRHWPKIERREKYLIIKLSDSKYDAVKIGLQRCTGGPRYMQEIGAPKISQLMMCMNKKLETFKATFFNFITWLGQIS